MRVAMMTREYPPEVYGGAGVHVAELVRHLRPLLDVDVHCMGGPRDDARVHAPDPALAGANTALRMLSAQLRMADAAAGADVMHSHTWYAGLAGHLAGQLHGAPHVLTAHSLEPRRPWKAEQLGGGYRLSSWSERTAVEHADAVVAVSAAMRADLLDTYPAVDPSRVHVVHNGIDPDLWYPENPAESGPLPARLGLRSDAPIAAFVGRISRQKGVTQLLAAARLLHPDIQLVLCAGAPDTADLAAEVAGAVEALRCERHGVVWIREQLPTDQIRQILSAATVFVCPSVYEPLGIVNLEAMATETAVVASDVGGIPEVVVDGDTGVLVHYDDADPESFPADLAASINSLAADPARAAALGRAGRARVLRDFTWTTVARQTAALYRTLV